MASKLGSRTEARVGIQFVNVGPPGQESKEEQTRTLSIVRSNAAHFHWRHNRPSGSHKLLKAPRSTQKRVRKDPKKPRKDPGLEVQSSHRARTGVVKRKNNRLQNSEFHVSQHGVLYNLSEAASMTMLPWRDTQLNPLATFASELPPYFINRCITYSKKIFTC